MRTIKLAIINFWFQFIRNKPNPWSKENFFKAWKIHIIFPTIAILPSSSVKKSFYISWNEPKLFWNFHENLAFQSSETLDWLWRTSHNHFCLLGTFLSQHCLTLQYPSMDLPIFKCQSRDIIDLIRYRWNEALNQSLWIGSKNEKCALLRCWSVIGDK